MNEQAIDEFKGKQASQQEINKWIVHTYQHQGGSFAPKLLEHYEDNQLHGLLEKYDDKGNKFNLMFIDGEHTDWACFRDFVHGRKLLTEDSIVVFHDSSLIYKSLKIIQEYMLASGKKFKFIKSLKYSRKYKSRY